MKTSRPQNIRVRLNREGASGYTKTSYPVRYGRYSEIDFNGFRFQFNLNGEVRHIAGTGPDWPHPAEWLKRTVGNDWVYYSTGNYYSGVVDLFGEYYFPHPAYPTNCLFKENPFSHPGVVKALAAAENIAALAREKQLLPEPGRNNDREDFQDLLGYNSAGELQGRADRLHRILKAQISVLPPDCRHVDYDVIPLMITDGCLYNCSFCEIKSGAELSCRSRDEISGQLIALKDFYGADLANYNSIYLGQHDTLAANPADIIFAAREAYKILQIKNSYMTGPGLFLFGSAESFLKPDKDFWDELNSLPFHTYINLGLESFDPSTLEFLKKPVAAELVIKAFERMLEVNRVFDRIEVTANFVLGEALPDGHIPALLARTGGNLGKRQARGCIYLSPLKGSRQTIELLDQFREIKLQSRLASFLYLIQRL